jgi:glycosyltransferase involved in cell wall biosynthesis
MPAKPRCSTLPRGVLSLSMKRLSLLVCSIESRRRELRRLRSCLAPQLNDAVELLVNIDRGEKTIGRKRNELLEEASGDYIAYIDDDDLVADDYVEKILNAVDSKPDCCGMEGIITFNGANPRRFIHSLRYREWFEEEGVYYRNPNHLSPVKRELALEIGFPEKNYWEDRDYSARLLPLLKREVYIEGPIYYYLYVKRKKPKLLRLFTEFSRGVRLVCGRAIGA